MGPEPGYWRMNKYHETFKKCPLPFTCLGHDKSFRDESHFTGICKKGYTGNLCFACADDYAKGDQSEVGECLKCSGNWLYDLQAVLVIVLALKSGYDAV